MTPAARTPKHRPPAPGVAAGKSPRSTNQPTDRPDGPAVTPPLPGTEHLGPSERGQYAEWVDLAQVRPNPDNVRPVAGPNDHAAREGIAELAASIRAQGLLEPLVVAPRPAEAVTATGRPEFLLIAGHRRRAAIELLMNTLDDTTAEPLHDGRVLVIVRPDLADPAGATAAALVENLHRVDLTPLQEARAFLALRDVHGWSQGAIARAIGRNPGHVSKRLTLLDAVPLLTELIEAGTIPLDVAGDLARLAPEFQQRAARDIARGQATPTQARAQALADADAASARTQAVQALDAAGLAYVELDHGQRPPSPSPAGPLPVDFPGYRVVLEAHDVPMGTAVPACEVRYVTRGRRHDVVTDRGANSYPGFDPAFVTGRVCTDPQAHIAAANPPAPPTTSTGPSTPEPSVRSRLFSDGSGYVPGVNVNDLDDARERAAGDRDADGMPANMPAPAWAGLDTNTDPSTPAPLTGTGRPTTLQGDRGVIEATMRRTAFTQRLLADKVPGTAPAAITAALLADVALAPEFALDPAADQAALRLAALWLGPAGAPLDGSATAARKAALAVTFGAGASTERRTRFALAYLLARTEPAVLEAVGRHAANPTAVLESALSAPDGRGTHPDVPPVTAVLAHQHLTLLAAWGHVLHPLEAAVVDAAPTPHAALASLGIGVDVLAPRPTAVPTVVDVTDADEDGHGGRGGSDGPDHDPTDGPGTGGGARRRTDAHGIPQDPTAFTDGPDPDAGDDPHRVDNRADNVVRLADSHSTRAGRVRFPTHADASRMSKVDLTRVLTRAGLPVPDGATKATLLAALDAARSRQLTTVGG